jgi:hypothetical protein
MTHAMFMQDNETGGIILGKQQNASGKPWIKIVKDRYLDRSFRDNEPVIRDEFDEWMIRLNEAYGEDSRPD